MARKKGRKRSGASSCISPKLSQYLSHRQWDIKMHISVSRAITKRTIQKYSGEKKNQKFTKKNTEHKKDNAGGTEDRSLSK